MLPLALMSGSATDSAGKLLFRGDDAYERGDYGSAADAYSEAEYRTTDPGLVAFNKAAALYRLGLYGEAESCYSRSLEDAEGERRSQAFYNLGNCLVQQARDVDAAMLERAIASYEQCLREEPTDSTLAADARSNLELAKDLLSRAKVREKCSKKPRAGQ